MLATLADRIPEMCMSAFGDELKRRRKEAKLSYDQLAELSGVSKTYLANLENDKPHNVTGKPPSPTPAVVDRIATALDWNVVNARTLAFVTLGEHHTDYDIEPALDDIHALHGRVLHKLPSGSARERYLRKLRASVEADLEMIEARIEGEE